MAAVRGDQADIGIIRHFARVVAERLFDESDIEPENEQGDDDFQPVVWHLPVCGMLREK
ncbi:hypothetical protein ACFDR6_29865 [Bradyrhizobium sp. 1AS20L]